MRQINHITVKSAKVKQPLTFAFVSDLHNARFDDLLPHFANCDAILIAGDLVDRHRDGYQRALSFLHAAQEVAPVFYSVGNHEWKLPSHDRYWPQVPQTGETVLEDRFVDFHGVTLGGLSSRAGDPDTAWLPEMAAQPGFKLLLCHHPEHFAPHVAPHDIDLTLSGHAHGGQWRFFGQGVFAPGQGLFPKWTSGFYFDGRLLVSRGVTNGCEVPRINCPCELIILHLEGED